MDLQRFEEIGRRIVAEREAAALKREEERQYWAYVRRQEMEANAPYLFPVAMVMLLALGLGIGLYMVGEQRQGAVAQFIQNLANLLLVIATISFITLVCLANVQFEF